MEVNSTYNDSIKDQIQNIIDSNDIVLFMKGNKSSPMCGFSSYVVNALVQHGQSFKDINILEDENLRNGVKIFSDWPTIPQLYIKGEFIGGCDIVKAMNDSGEFKELLTQHNLIK